MRRPRTRPLRPLYLEIGGVLELLEETRADYLVDGRGALGQIALNHAPLAFLGATDRAACCDAPLARHLPEALPLRAVLSHLQSMPRCC